MQFVSFQMCDFTSTPPQAPLPLGKCFVYLTGTATLAQLYDGSGSPISNPVIADSNAMVGFAAADGIYDYQFAYPSGAPAGPKVLKQGIFDTTQAARVLYEAPTIPQRYYQATDANFGFCVQRALDDLRLNHSHNPSPGGFYVGSNQLLIPSGGYAMGANTIVVSHSVIVRGEGDGFIYSGGQGTKLSWNDGINGFQVEAANTSGNTTIDGSTHAGAFLWMRDICLEGGFAGTEGDFHGIVLRSGAKLSNVYIRNFPGAGIRSWTGTVSGQGSFAGNTSLNCFESVTSESNREAFDSRGTDSNVLMFLNCNAFQNRLAGFIDDNGAGSNNIIGGHGASNGGITGAWAQTQCSYLGNRYAAKWGGNFTVAPSGDTTDTANWFYIEAGGAVAGVIPAWVSTANTFRAGGDYVTLNSASVALYNSYAEYGGFSQFNSTTRIDEGTLGDQYFRGGTRVNSGPSGFRIRQTPNAALILQHHSTEGDLLVQDEVNVVHSRILFSKSFGNFYGARDISGHVFQTAPYNGAWTTIASIDPTGLRTVSGQLGYGTGVGGTVTQATNKSTGVTLNKTCGQVTMNAAALASAAKVSFVVTNSTVAATDLVLVSVASGGTANAYRAAVTAVAGGSFTVTVENITGGSLSEAPVINFAVLKAVAA